MAGRFNFFTEGVTFTLPQKRRVRTWLHTVILKSKLTYHEVNFIFCSDSYLIKINKTFLHHDYLTDIITFSSSTQKQLLSGDIFISIERVTENAETFKNSFIKELHRVMVHGILHLIGYKDKTKLEKQLMRKMENRMLKLYDIF